MAGVKNSELKNGMERHSLLMLNAALKREFSLNVKTIIKLKTMAHIRGMNGTTCTRCL
jgi:hypothetical protein